MPYHNWSDQTVDWKGLGDAAEYIGTWLRNWGRIGISTYKEKFGTVRVYITFGWYQMFSITHPGYCYSCYPQWLWSIDCRYLSRLMFLLNWAVVPIQKLMYRFRYRQAIRKWPHLTGEILMGADYPELLVGLDKNFHRTRLRDEGLSWQIHWTGYTGGRTDWTGGVHDPEKEEEETEAEVQQEQTDPVVVTDAIPDPALSPETPTEPRG